ncbi:hypothetical protein DFP72DRAFT_839819 [Ephemerocybe angulata]|uniref:Uncharacterized protein n=1 Tax=Ephemerocybe angulata TaxID=980116 RepID=A0A8H6MGG7_9AGAR|nr:hypothetical protein DFP72DRAFT_839819 [Tulosesus angulatus]
MFMVSEFNSLVYLRTQNTELKEPVGTTILQERMGPTTLPLRRSFPCCAGGPASGREAVFCRLELRNSPSEFVHPIMNQESSRRAHEGGPPKPHRREDMPKRASASITASSACGIAIRMNGSRIGVPWMYVRILMCQNSITVALGGHYERLYKASLEPNDFEHCLSNYTEAARSYAPSPEEQIQWFLKVAELHLTRAEDAGKLEAPS